MNISESPNLISECKTIEENCMYTAAAHYELEKYYRRCMLMLMYVLAIMSAVSGTCLVMGFPATLGWLGIFSGFASALVTALDADKKTRTHGNYAREFTVLRHEARTTYQTFAPELEKEEVVKRVGGLVKRYEELVLCSPSTTDRAFKKAKQRINTKVYTPDFVESEKNMALMEKAPKMPASSNIPGAPQ